MRVDAIRRANGINPEEMTRAMQPPDVSAPYYQKAFREAAQELSVVADTLVTYVDEVTKRRRHALGLDASGYDPGSNRTLDRRAARGGVSMAELQGLFIRYPDDPHVAVDAWAVEQGLKEL